MFLDSLQSFLSFKVITLEVLSIYVIFQEVVSFLIKCGHDTHKLIEDKAFVVDLMMLTKTAALKNKAPLTSKTAFGTDISSSKSMEILEEFILASSVPVDVAAKLSRAFFLASNREKEQSKGLLKCAEYCENLAVELLEICR